VEIGRDSYVAVVCLNCGWRESGASYGSHDREIVALVDDHLVEYGHEGHTVEVVRSTITTHALEQP
jgi:hypothetical protein